jgi:hypothetical protein
MPHLDEGQLNALLDSELDEAETSAAQAHLAECPECRRQYEEARAMALEAERLVGLIEVSTRPDAPSGRARSAGWATFARWKTLAWAATVVLAAGFGWLASDLRHAPVSLDERLLTSTRADSPSAEPSTATPPPSLGLEGRSAKVAPAPEPSPPERRAQPASPPASVAARLATDSGKDPKAAADALGRVTVRDAKEEAARLNAAEAPALGGFADAAASRAAEADARVPPAAPAQGVRPYVAAQEFRGLEMEEAVRQQAGAIRLVDGLVPVRILSGPGSGMAGGDPAQPMIRVVYEDPPGRELWLDQQRPGPVADGPSLQLRGRVLLPGDTMVTALPGGLRSLRWIDQHGFRLALTGFLPDDSLRVVMSRVH